MSLMFVDWKCPDEEQDRLWDIRSCDNQDVIGLTEDDIRKMCKERIVRVLIPTMNILLLTFVWIVSLFYGSVLMPTVLTVIIIVLFVFNYLEEHAIRHSLSEIIHLKRVNNSDKTETKVQTLERSDSNQSKINYFNYSQNYYIETIDEICEEFEDDSHPHKYSRRSITG